MMKTGLRWRQIQDSDLQSFQHPDHNHQPNHTRCQEETRQNSCLLHMPLPLLHIIRQQHQHTTPQVTRAKRFKMSDGQKGVPRPCIRPQHTHQWANRGRANAHCAARFVNDVQTARWLPKGQARASGILSAAQTRRTKVCYPSPASPSCTRHTPSHG